MRTGPPRLRAGQHQSHNRGVLRLSYLFRELRQTLGLRDAHRQVERLLDDVIEAAQTRAAAGENESSGNLAVQASALEIVANEREQFHGARLDDVGQHVREDRARRAVANAGDFNRAVIRDERRSGPAVAALDALGLGSGRAQADGKIVGEMVAADGNHADVTNNSAAIGDDFRRATAG